MYGYTVAIMFELEGVWITFEWKADYSPFNAWQIVMNIIILALDKWKFVLKN